MKETWKYNYYLCFLISRHHDSSRLTLWNKVIGLRRPRSKKCIWFFLYNLTAISRPEGARVQVHASSFPVATIIHVHPRKSSAISTGINGIWTFSGKIRWCSVNNRLRDTPRGAILDPANIGCQEGVYRHDLPRKPHHPLLRLRHVRQVEALGHHGGAAEHRRGPLRVPGPGARRDDGPGRGLGALPLPRGDE